MVLIKANRRLKYARQKKPAFKIYTGISFVCKQRGGKEKRNWEFVWLSNLQ